MNDRRMSGRSGLGVVRVLLGIAGAVFLTIALARSWDEGVGRLDLDWWRLASATALLAAASGSLARSWATILRDLAPPGELVRGYLRAQPAKYVPGGWAQPVSQVAHTANLGAHVGRATVAYPVQAVCLMVAGATLGSGLGFAEDPSSTLRWVSLAGLISLVLLSRRWMMATLALVGRALRRGGWESLVPPQEAILKCFVWSLCAIGLMAAAFSLLAAGSYSGFVPPFTMMSVFSLAWVAGFVAIPVPAGVGVREAVLISVLGSAGPASVAIALSIAHRALQMIAELVLVAGSGIRPESSRPGACKAGDGG